MKDECLTTHKHTHTHIYIYIYIYVCVCVKYYIINSFDVSIKVLKLAVYLPKVGNIRDRITINFIVTMTGPFKTSTYKLSNKQLPFTVSIFTL